MECITCVRIFKTVGEIFNSSSTAEEQLDGVAKAIVEHLEIKACHFRLLSRDQLQLEHIASYGLSRAFLDKGPVDAERSVSEAMRGGIVMVDDVASDPRIQYPEEHVAEGIASLLTVPLKTRGQVIGVMRLSTADRRKFSEQELTMIETLAAFATSAITRSMFNDILGDVTKAVRSSLDLGEVLDTITRVVCESLRAKGCTIRLVGRHGEIDLRAASGLSRQYLESASQNPGEGVHRALKGECVFVLDAQNDPLIRHRDEATRERIGSALFAPMMIRDEAIGVLSLYTHKQYQFSEDEIQLMTTIGEQCALAIRNAQMYAAIKRKYEDVVDEFQQWFAHYQTYPLRD